MLPKLAVLPGKPELFRLGVVLVQRLSGPPPATRARFCPLGTTGCVLCDQCFSSWLEAGGVDYVTQPIVIEEMLARIRVHLGNARLTQSARAALDVSGRLLFAVNRQSHILWATPQAQKLLADHHGAQTDDFILPPFLLQWLEQAKSKGSAKSQAVSLPDNPQLRFYFMGETAPNEFLLRLSRESGTSLPPEFTSELGLTTREGEVLAWLSKGKTNRDIAQFWASARARSTSIWSRSTPSWAWRTGRPRRRLPRMRRGGIRRATRMSGDAAHLIIGVAVPCPLTHTQTPCHPDPSSGSRPSRSSNPDCAAIPACRRAWAAG